MPLKTRAAQHLSLSRSGIAIALALVAAIAWASGAAAHAEPVRANPPINGSVATSPSQVQIWFSEEATSATTIKVYGPDGVRVDLGDTKLDLQDAQRVHVTVDLLKELNPGTYKVQWSSVSGTDGDAANGEFSFAIGAGTPVASPAASPAASAAAANLTPAPASTEIPEKYKTSKVDDRALGIGIGAGILAAVAIYLFWRWIRPRNSVV